jgi:hypothetical protein
VLARGPVISPFASLVVVGSDDDYEYVGHYALDVAGDEVRIVSAWSECAWMEIEELDIVTYFPLERIVRELTGKRLDASDRTATAASGPMLRLGCYANAEFLEGAVDASRARKNAATRIQRAFRRSFRRRTMVGPSECSDLNV